jgi:glycosyltransferase involved in cell wall biosynthesis
VIEGESGFCTSRNVGGARLITRLAYDKELRVSVGGKGFARIRNFFSIDRMGKEFNDLYNSYV